MSGEAARALSNAALEARLHELQRRAFEAYEDAALAAEGRGDRNAYARAEAQTAPLIAEAKAINDERVRRLRARARGWRVAGIAVGVAGAALVVWLLLQG